MSWIQTSRGLAIDLARPDWTQIDFAEMASVLARIARFTGHVASGPYSVAQHSVIGADAVFEETGSAEAAGAFLLHDGHEHLLGDQSRPHQDAEIVVAQQLFGQSIPAALIAIRREMKDRADRAIYLAAGMGINGCPAEYRKIVKLFDERMLITERDQLLGKSPRPWHTSLENADRIRMRGGLKVWTWTRAAEEFCDRMNRYLPFAMSRPEPNPVCPFTQPQEA